MMRHTVSKAQHLPPYTLLTGRGPALPIHLPEHLPRFPLEPSEDQEAEYTEWLLTRVEQLYKLAGQRMDTKEQRLKELLKKKEQAAPTTFFHFRPM